MLSNECITAPLWSGCMSCDQLDTPHIFPQISEFGINITLSYANTAT